MPYPEDPYAAPTASASTQPTGRRKPPGMPIWSSPAATVTATPAATPNPTVRPGSPLVAAPPAEPRSYLDALGGMPSRRRESREERPADRWFAPDTGMTDRLDAVADARRAEQRQAAAEAERAAALSEREQRAAAEMAQRQRNFEVDQEAKRLGRDTITNPEGDRVYTDTMTDWAVRKQAEQEDALKEAEYRREGRSFYTDPLTKRIAPEIPDAEWRARQQERAATDRSKAIESARKDLETAEAATRDTLTAEERRRLEARQAERQTQIRAALAERLASDPAATETTGGFLGFGARPTDRAASLAARRNELETGGADPTPEEWAALEQDEAWRPAVQEYRQAQAQLATDDENRAWHDDRERRRLDQARAAMAALTVAPGQPANRAEGELPTQPTRRDAVHGTREAAGAPVSQPNQAPGTQNPEQKPLSPADYNAAAEDYQYAAEELAQRDAVLSDQIAMLDQRAAALVERGLSEQERVTLPDGRVYPRALVPDLIDLEEKQFAHQRDTAAERERLAAAAEPLRLAGEQLRQQVETARLEQRAQRAQWTADLRKREPALAPVADEIEALERETRSRIDRAREQFEPGPELDAALDTITRDTEARSGELIQRVQGFEGVRDQIGQLAVSTATEMARLDAFHAQDPASRKTAADEKQQVFSDAWDSARKLAKQAGLPESVVRPVWYDAHRSSQAWLKDEQARVLPGTGRVIINPAIAFDDKAVTAALDQLEASPSAKQQARENLPSMRRRLAVQLLPTLRELGDFRRWEAKNAHRFRGADDDPEAGMGVQAESEMATAYFAELDQPELVEMGDVLKTLAIGGPIGGPVMGAEKALRGIPGGRRVLNQVAEGLEAGAHDIRTQFHALPAAVSTLLADHWLPGLQEYATTARSLAEESAARAEQSAAAAATTPAQILPFVSVADLSRGATSLAPVVATGGLTGGLVRAGAAGSLGRIGQAALRLSGGGAALSGGMSATQATNLAAQIGLRGASGMAFVQSFGGTYVDARKNYLAQGYSDTEAGDAALRNATLAGLTTFALTRLGGQFGPEALLAGDITSSRTAMGAAELVKQLAAGTASRQMFKRELTNLGKQLFLNASGEGIEEWADETIQGLITYGTNAQPGMTLHDVINQGMTAGWIGAGLGGGTVAIQESAGGMAGALHVMRNRGAARAEQKRAEDVAATLAGIDAWTGPDRVPEGEQWTDQDTAAAKARAKALTRIAAGVDPATLAPEELAAVGLQKKGGKVEAAKAGLQMADYELEPMSQVEIGQEGRATLTPASRKWLDTYFPKVARLTADLETQTQTQTQTNEQDLAPTPDRPGQDPQPSQEQQVPQSGDLSALPAQETGTAAIRAADNDPEPVSGGPETPQAGLTQRAKEIAAEWDRANRGSRTDEWFANAHDEAAAAGFAEAAAAGNAAAHGMAKEATLSGAVESLLKLLNDGVDVNRGRGGLDTAPLVSTGKGAGAGTASGSAYTDGPFVVLADPGIGLITKASQIQAVLVNEAHAGDLNFIEALRQAVTAIRPDVIVETYSGAGRAISNMGKGQTQSSLDSKQEPDSDPTLSGLRSDPVSSERARILANLLVDSRGWDPADARSVAEAHVARAGVLESEPRVQLLKHLLPEIEQALGVTSKAKAATSGVEKGQAAAARLGVVETGRAGDAEKVTTPPANQEPRTQNQEQNRREKISTATRRALADRSADLEALGITIRERDENEDGPQAIWADPELGEIAIRPAVMEQWYGPLAGNEDALALQIAATIDEELEHFATFEAGLAMIQDARAAQGKEPLPRRAAISAFKGKMTEAWKDFEQRHARTAELFGKLYNPEMWSQMPAYSRGMEVARMLRQRATGRFGGMTTEQVYSALFGNRSQITEQSARALEHVLGLKNQPGLPLTDKFRDILRAVADFLRGIVGQPKQGARPQKGADYLLELLEATEAVLKGPGDRRQESAANPSSPATGDFIIRKSKPDEVWEITTIVRAGNEGTIYGRKRGSRGSGRPIGTLDTFADNWQPAPKESARAKMRREMAEASGTTQQEPSTKNEEPRTESPKRATLTRRTRAPRDRDDTPVLNYIRESKILAKNHPAAMKRMAAMGRARKKGLPPDPGDRDYFAAWDGAPKLADQPAHVRPYLEGIFSRTQGLPPDEMADELASRGLIPPDGRFGDMYEAIDRELRTIDRDLAPRGLDEQGNPIVDPEQQAENFARDVLSPDATKEERLTNELAPGDILTLEGGEKLRVTRVLPTGAVVLDDGQTYGTQVIQEDDRVYVDLHQRADGSVVEVDPSLQGFGAGRPQSSKDSQDFDLPVARDSVNLPQDVERLGPYQIALAAGADPQKQADAIAESFGEFGAGLEAAARIIESGPPTERGEEHSVWLDEDAGRVIKATRGGRFGVSKSPAEYLRRLILRNRHLGDDVRFLGAHKQPDGSVVLLTEQPIYEGEFATPAEIESYFKARGYVRVGTGAFYNGDLVIQDASSKNVIRSADGVFHAFDVQVREPATREQERLDDIYNSADRLYAAQPRTQNEEPGTPKKTYPLTNGGTLRGPGLHSLPAAPPRLYHGTPHKVDRFSLDKIGTGEGAQVYGWGLYFAEEQKVALEYRDKLVQVRSWDALVHPEARTWRTLEFLENVRRNRTNPDYIEEYAHTLTEKDARPAEKNAILGYADYVRGNGHPTFSGNLYTVQIEADEDEFLDWDKPLSEQSETVQRAWKQIEKNARFDREVYTDEKLRGSDLYFFSDPNPYGGGSDSKAARDVLLAAGIRGIRYLDGMSRDGGSGTHNYVIFDESIIRIREENGQPVNLAEDTAGRLNAARPTRNQEPGTRNTPFDPTLADLEKRVARGEILTPAERADLERRRDAAGMLAFGLDDATVSPKTLQQRRQREELEQRRNQRLVGSDAGEDTDLFTGGTAAGQGLLFAGRPVQSLLDTLPAKPGALVNGLLQGRTLAESATAAGYPEPVAADPDRLQRIARQTGLVLTQRAQSAGLTPEQVREGFEALAAARPGGGDLESGRGGVSPQEDAAYLYAVERGDLATAQRMVDAAAKAAGYRFKLFRGDSTNFNEFDPFKKSENFTSAIGFSFSDDLETAAVYGKVREFFIKGKTWTVDYLADLYGKTPESAEDWQKAYDEEVLAEFIGADQVDTNDDESIDKFWNEKNASIIRIKNIADNSLTSGGDRLATLFIIKSPSQIKSADPVTYDDQGQVIPLSRRFDSSSDSILFAGRPGSRRNGQGFFDFGLSGELTNDPNQIAFDFTAPAEVSPEPLSTGSGRAGYHAGDVVEVHPPESAQTEGTATIIGEVPSPNPADPLHVVRFEDDPSQQYTRHESDFVPAESPATTQPDLLPVAPAIGVNRDFGEKIGDARKDLAEKSGRTEKPKAAKPDAKPAWMKGWDIVQIVSEVNRWGASTPNAGKWTFSKDTDRRNSFYYPRNPVYDTREEAERMLPAFVVSQKHRVYRDRDNETQYAIFRNVTDRKRVVIKGGFATEEDALRYMAENAKEILETKTGHGEEILSPRDDQPIYRKGPSRRTRPADAALFADTFQFRGVEFGNWVTSEEGQDVLNHAYDGLMDLAEFLNVPPRALSLNGELALAFGARGQGLSGARAHYERDRVVINLTKMKGAGSLAHEWMHAVDHYFARQEGRASSEWEYLPDGTRRLKAKAADSDFMTAGDYLRTSKLRPEVAAAWKQLREIMTRKTVQKEIDQTQAQKWADKSLNEMRGQLDAVRAGLAKEAPYGSRKAPATADQLARWDRAVESLVSGGAGELAWRAIPNSAAKWGDYAWSNDAFDELSKIHKEVRNRAGLKKEGGALEYAIGYYRDYRRREKKLEMANAGEQETQMVPTEYAREAHLGDMGRTGDYWSHPWEMAARAFSSYIEDKAAASSVHSGFLSMGSTEADNLFFKMFYGFKPYPEKAERTAINAALDGLFGSLKTEETDTGTRLYAARPVQSLLDTLPAKPGALVNGLLQGRTLAESATAAGYPEPVTADPDRLQRIARQTGLVLTQRAQSAGLTPEQVREGFEAISGTLYAAAPTQNQAQSTKNKRPPGQSALDSAAIRLTAAVGRASGFTGLADSLARWYESDPLARPLRKIIDIARREAVPLHLLDREVTSHMAEMRVAQAFGQEQAMDVLRAVSGRAKFSDLAWPKQYANDAGMRRRLWMAMTGNGPGLDTLPPEVATIGRRMRALLEEAGMKAVREGRMHPDTFEDLRGTYLPEYYLEHELAQTNTPVGIFRKLKLGMNEILAQRMTGFRIEDTEEKDETGQDKLVTYTEPGSSRQRWRFRDRDHRDAYWETYTRRRAVEAMQHWAQTAKSGLPRAEQDAIRALPPDALDRMEQLPDVIRGYAAGHLATMRRRYRREKPLTIAEREKAGLIMDPVYSVAKYLAHMEHDNATAKFFNILAADATGKKWIGPANTDGYTQIPDHAKFGALRSKWVKTEIASQVMELVGAASDAMRAYDATMTLFKTGKTVWNPGTHVRNVLGNVMFAHLAGVNSLNPLNAPHYRNALQTIWKGGETLEEMYREGVLGGDFLTAELRGQLQSLLPLDTVETAGDPWMKLTVLLQKAVRKSGASHLKNWVENAYQLEDEVYKAAAYLKAKQSGMDPKAAAAHVRKWFAYYDQIGTSGSIKLIRRTAMPFFSFQREALRILGNAARERPIALAYTLALPAILTQISFALLGIGEKDKEEVRKTLNGKGRFFGRHTPLFSMLLPKRDGEGRLAQFDLTNVMPFASLLGRRREFDDAEPLLQSLAKDFIAGSPIVGLPLEVATNQDFFTGNRLWEDNMTGTEKARQIAAQAWSTLMPPLVPPIPGVTNNDGGMDTGGGTGWNMLAQAGERRTNRSLERRNEGQSLARGLVGIDIKSAAPSIYDLVDAYMEARGIPRTESDPPGTTPESRARRRIWDALVKGTDREAAAGDEAEALRRAAEAERAIAEEMAYLRSRGRPIETESDVRRLVSLRNPAMVFSRVEDRQDFERNYLRDRPETAQAWREAIRAYESTLARGKGILTRAIGKSRTVAAQ